MADIEVYLKWAIIGGVAIGAIFFLYKFAEGQGWFTVGRGMVTRRFRGEPQGWLSWRLHKSTKEYVENPTIFGTLPPKGMK